MAEQGDILKKCKATLEALETELEEERRKSSRTAAERQRIEKELQACKDRERAAKGILFSYFQMNVNLRVGKLLNYSN